MTNLLHELRCFTGGELGNRAADEIERQAKLLRIVDRWITDDPDLCRLTIETVSQWLDTQGLCAVSKADAVKFEQCKAACIAETRDDKGDFIKWYVQNFGIPPRDFTGYSHLFNAFVAGRTTLEQKP